MSSSIAASGGSSRTFSKSELDHSTSSYAVLGTSPISDGGLLNSKGFGPENGQQSRINMEGSNQRGENYDPRKTVNDGGTTVTYKLHKSCDYCRHRKIKCVRRPGSEICDHCRICEVECTFSRKMPSKKRKLRSARIVASLRDRDRLGYEGSGIGSADDTNDSMGMSIRGRGSVSEEAVDNGNFIAKEESTASPKDRNHLTAVKIEPESADSEVGSGEGAIGNATVPGVPSSVKGVSVSTPIMSYTQQGTGMTPLTAGGWYYEPFFDLIYSAKASPMEDPSNGKSGAPSPLPAESVNEESSAFPQASEGLQGNSKTDVFAIHGHEVHSTNHVIPTTNHGVRGDHDDTHANNRKQTENNYPSINGSTDSPHSQYTGSPNIAEMALSGYASRPNTETNSNNNINTNGNANTSSNEPISASVSVTTPGGTAHALPLDNNSNLTSLAIIATEHNASLTVPSNHSRRLPEDPQAVRDAYTLYIEPCTPFFPPEFYDASDMSTLARCCMSLASFSSPNSVAPVGSIAMLYEVVDQLVAQETVWNEFSLSAVFCVLVRYKLPYDRVSRAINQFIKKGPQHYPSPGINYNLLIGALSAYAWNSLVAYDNLRPPNNDEAEIIDIYETVTSNISEDTFAYHFLYVSTLLCRFKVLMILPDEVYSPESLASGSPQHDDAWYSTRKSLIRLEYELLLWPVRLPKHLTVVKDDLIATPGALILHVLHNTVLLAYYIQAIRHKDPYGRMLSILPVPGLLQFLCGMAASSFKCQPDIIEKWPIIRDCLVITARLMLELYNQTEYENCKVALALYQDSQTAPGLYNSIQKVLAAVDWAANDKDGAALYWIFRDVRSMSLQHLL
ncbi:hypothetical protein AWJ20_3734 [Sugiyamaella lignohabitans]|uniref:Zn(2)-C6 fungal-type domain-containing protein n=1 Tax=Sugiyamaella lignohabitans TaxID=796027 RepID=A0A167BXA5_9ASCO|nr:uncharacterized protein AWJ20_3734 [Sugiyamaella lignohabitans]ANB10940.1 hypothetical protein AWJ20_3734 [Sugiyamaella lignohabitans]